MLLRFITLHSQMRFVARLQKLRTEFRKIMDKSIMSWLMRRSSLGSLIQVILEVEKQICLNFGTVLAGERYGGVFSRS